jgi:ABC-type glycerol-3-phosphate transport system permease component
MTGDTGVAVRGLIAKIAIAGIMVLALLFVLFPVYWMVITSLKLPREIFRVLRFGLRFSPKPTIGR